MNVTADLCIVWPIWTLFEKTWYLATKKCLSCLVVICMKFCGDNWGIWAYNQTMGCSRHLNVLNLSLQFNLHVWMSVISQTSNYFWFLTIVLLSFYVISIGTYFILMATSLMTWYGYYNFRNVLYSNIVFIIFLS